MPAFSVFGKERRGEAQQVSEKQQTGSQEPDALTSQEAEDSPVPGVVLETSAAELSQETMALAGEEPQEDAEQEGQEAPQAGEPESDDNLLDIFKTEMAEDPEFEALVDGLEEIDMQELAQQSRELADHLRTLHRSGS